MARRSHDVEAGERTREITGLDASMDEAEIGDAGNGADPFGGDLAGGLPHPIEDEPDQPDDILPDQIRRLERGGEAPARSGEEGGEAEITAQPNEAAPDYSELP